MLSGYLVVPPNVSADVKPMSLLLEAAADAVFAGLVLLLSM